MNFFRTKILILLMVVAAGATFYYFGDPQKLFETSMQTLEKTPLRGVAQQIQSIGGEKTDKESLTATIQNAEIELSQLSARTKEVAEHAGNILGESKLLESPIEATENATPIHERAFEYGKYMYCKTVVNDYEKFNNL